MELATFEGFDWDLGNIAKVQSRLDLSMVEFAFHGSPYVAFDETHSLSEKRWLLVNKIHDRFVFVSFTTRDKKIRVISARYMGKKEAKNYEDWFNEV